MKKIEKLTKKQEKMIPKWAEKWIKIGLKTGKTDWKTFDKYMPICFKKAGLEYPKRIVRVQSPIVGAFASSIAGKILNNGAVHGAVGGAVRDAVHGAVDDAVGDAVHDAVRVAVGGAVGDAVDGAVHGAKIRWHYWLGGQFWVGGWYWYGSPSVVSFFTDVCKLKLSKDMMERAEAYSKVCQSVNYIWLNKDFVMVCARPKKINRNEQGQLHSLIEKSIIYPDGWGLYYIHGVKFTEEQFKKSQTATISDILSWEDIDQRSVLLRDKPLEELLKKVPKKLIDKTKECGGYELYEIELKDIGKARILSYHGWSSEKPYAKFVPVDSEKCLETVAKLRQQSVEDLINSIKS